MEERTASIERETRHRFTNDSPTKNVHLLWHGRILSFFFWWWLWRRSRSCRTVNIGLEGQYGCTSRKIGSPLLGGSIHLNNSLCVRWFPSVFEVLPALFTLWWGEKDIPLEEKGPNRTSSSSQSSSSFTPFGGACGSCPSPRVTSEPFAGESLSINKLVSN